MSTKRLISDQVLYRLYGGPPDAAAPVQKYDVWKATEQKLNTMFGMSQFTMNLPSGETIPNNLCLATYEDIAVTSISDYSTATLPVMPISLPLNAGINQIRPTLSKSGTDRIYGQPMIPLQAGQSFLLDADSLLSDLMGQFGYEVNGKTILFTKDLTTLDITTVQMKLVVFDMSQYSETDVLPLPSDMEEKIINELVAQFDAVIAETGIVNPVTTAGQQQQGIK